LAWLRRLLPLLGAAEPATHAEHEQAISPWVTISPAMSKVVLSSPKELSPLSFFSFLSSSQFSKYISRSQDFLISIRLINWITPWDLASYR
jgi:hypothetical protein